MVIVIKGLSGIGLLRPDGVVQQTDDLSPWLDRQDTFEIEAATGDRMDMLTMTFFDKFGQLAIPERAEIIIYDIDPAILPVGWTAFPAQPPVVDPPAANTTDWLYNLDEQWVVG